MATWDKNCRSQPSISYPFDIELFLLLLQNSGIGCQYLTKILGLGPNFWDWAVAQILAAHTPYEFIAVAAGSVIGVISLITLFFKRKSLNQFAAPT